MAVTGRDVRYFLLSLAILVAFIGAYQLSQALTSAEDQPAPPLRLTTLDGTVFDLADHRGNVVVLDFFTTWCEPCLTVERELGELVNASSVNGLVVLSIGADLGENETQLTAYAQKHGIPWGMARATASVLQDWDVHQYPHVVVVDRDGHLEETFMGLPPPGGLERAIREAA